MKEESNFANRLPTCYRLGFVLFGAPEWTRIPVQRFSSVLRGFVFAVIAGSVEIHPYGCHFILGDCEAQRGAVWCVYKAEKEAKDNDESTSGKAVPILRQRGYSRELAAEEHVTVILNLVQGDSIG